MNRKVLPRITKILKVEPFKLLTLWNNAETRTIDFEPMFQIWQKNNDFALLKLQNFDLFKGVSVSSSRTLEWANIPISLTFKGVSSTQPLELDPDVLYQNSTLVRQVERISVGQILRKTREELGLTQSEVATNSGTTRHYISRIENEQSDIQIDTLQKIIELGFGKKCA